MARTDRGRKRIWRFRLNEDTILEVSAPEGPTEKQVRRRGRVSLVLGIVLAALMVSAVAGGAVWTDQQDYTPGSVVTISGDNGNGAGYVAGETVKVDISGPNEYSASCQATVDENGAWSCQVTLWDSLDAVGSYGYTATGQESGIKESGAFTDAINMDTYESTCNTATSSFAAGSTVCVKVTGIPGPSPGSSGTIKWWKPGLDPATDTPTRTHNFAATTGNVQDTFQVNDCGTWNVRADVNTSSVTTKTDTFTVTGCTPTNSQPVVTANDASFDEGTSTSYSASWTDSGGGSQTHSCTIDFGEGSAVMTGTISPAQPSTSGTCTANHTYADGPNSFTITVKVNDGSGAANAEGSDTATATVNNVAPTTTLSSGNTLTWDESGTAERTFNFSVSDPGNDTYTATSGYPDCGTGGTYVTASLSVGTSGSQTGSFKCKFLDGPASPTVSIGFTDSDGAAGNVSSQDVTVNNVAPIVAAPSFSGASVDCRTSVNLTGISFSDPGINDADWTVDIDWGDGSTHTSYTTATQGAQPNQSHSYVTPGSYTATATVTDKDDEDGSNTSSNQVLVNQAYTVGFRQPIDPSNPTKLVGNTFKSGRVVPVKATIYDICAQAYVNDPATNVTIVLRDGGQGSLVANDAVEVFADPGAANSNTLLFRWTADATIPGGGFWIYNLDSRTFGNGPMLVGHNYFVDIFVGTNRATKSQWAVLTPTK